MSLKLGYKSKPIAEQLNALGYTYKEDLIKKIQDFHDIACDMVPAHMNEEQLNLYINYLFKKVMDHLSGDDNQTTPESMGVYKIHEAVKHSYKSFVGTQRGSAGKGLEMSNIDEGEEPA